MNAKRKAVWEAKLLSRKDGSKGKGKAKRAAEDVDDTEGPESKKVKSECVLLVPYRKG